MVLFVQKKKKMKRDILKCLKIFWKDKSVNGNYLYNKDRKDFYFVLFAMNYLHIFDLALYLKLSINDC